MRLKWKSSRRYIRDVIMVALIMLISLFAENILFQWEAFFNEKYEKNFTLEDADSISTSKGNTTCTYLLEGDYVRYLYLAYESDSNLDSTIVGTALDGYGNKEEFEVEDTASSVLNKSAVEIEKKVQKISITFRTVNASSFSGVTFTNKLVFNWARFLLVFFGLTIGYCIIAYGNLFGKRPEILYAVISVALGIVIILSAHHAFDSWDEQIHYEIAYTDSWFLNYVEYSDSTMANMEMRVPAGDTVEEEQWIGQWLNDSNQKIVLSSVKRRLIKYTQRAYIPQILGLALGRNFGMPYTTTIFLGKLFNLLFCTTVVACAIHFTKYGKRTLMCVGLLPTTIFLFSSFTYDAFVIALLMLGIALFLTEYMGQEKLRVTRTMISITAIIVGCFSKAVYIPFLALYWLMPKEKFNSKRQKILFKAGIAVLLVIMMASFVLPILSSAATGTDVTGDYRGGDTSQTSQLSMILGYPLTYTAILLKSIGTTVVSYFMGISVLTNFAYRGIYSGFGYYLVMLTMLFVFMTDYSMTQKRAVTEHSAKIPNMAALKIWTAVLLFGTACLIWTALYLDFTPVGSMVIKGVSPRYYLPMIFPLSILFMNRRLKLEISEINYHRIEALFMLIGTGMTIYYLMIVG